MICGVNTADMGRSKGPQLEPLSSHAYNEKINELRKEEYPMLSGTKVLYGINVRLLI